MKLPNHPVPVPKKTNKGPPAPPASEYLPALRIAHKLGLAPSTLQVYLRKPGAPLPNGKRHYPFSRVKGFIERNAGWALAGGTGQEMRQRKLEIEISAKEFELELRRGQFISKHDVASTLIPLVQEIDDLIRQEFELVLPARYVGKNEVECAQLNAAARDSIIRRFKTGSIAAQESLAESAQKAG